MKIPSFVFQKLARMSIISIIPVKTMRHQQAVLSYLFDLRPLKNKNTNCFYYNIETSFFCTIFLHFLALLMSFLSISFFPPNVEAAELVDKRFVIPPSLLLLL